MTDSYVKAKKKERKDLNKIVSDNFGIKKKRKVHDCGGHSGEAYICKLATKDSFNWSETAMRDKLAYYNGKGMLNINILPMKIPRGIHANRRQLGPDEDLSERNSRWISTHYKLWPKLRANFCYSGKQCLDNLDQLVRLLNPTPDEVMGVKVQGGNCTPQIISSLLSVQDDITQKEREGLAEKLKLNYLIRRWIVYVATCTLSTLGYETTFPWWREIHLEEIMYLDQEDSLVESFYSAGYNESLESFFAF